MDDFHQKYSSYRRLYVRHLLILVFGFVLGVAAAYYFNLINFDFSKEIEEARRLGIVSHTVLSGYPKSRDLLTYVSVLGFPAVFSIGIWTFWATGDRRKKLKKIFYRGNTSLFRKDIRWVICLFFVIFCYLLIIFDASFFFRPGYSPSIIGAWPFLGEEGENLAWAQSILSGGVYGKDFFCLYGPMLVYPLAWAMKVFGTTVVVERGYTFFLNVSAHSIIIFFLYRTLKHKLIFILSSLFYILTFSPLFQLAPNLTYLRVMLGILPFVFAYIYSENGNKYYLPVMGLIVGQSLLFSQEVGLCSFISVCLFLFFQCLAKEDWRGLLKEIPLFLTGCLVSIVPMLMYLYLKGAIVPFFESIYGYPKLLTLGYGGIPFTEFRQFIRAPLSGIALFQYGVIFVYIFAFIYLAPFILLRRIDKKVTLKLTLLVFGILLYRIALGRSDLANIYKASPPAFLLVFLFADQALSGIQKTHFSFLRWGNAFLILTLITSISLLIANTPYLALNMKITSNEMFKFRKRWTYLKMWDHIPDGVRGNILFDQETRQFISKINSFLNTYTKPSDAVYFFPNEAAYYFLFNRNNPTRYAISYFAITSEMRNELVADLEKNKPEYVIYSLKTWRVDDINEKIQVPEVVDYLRNSYKTILTSGDVLIMKRI